MKSRDRLKEEGRVEKRGKEEGKKERKKKIKEQKGKEREGLNIKDLVTWKHL